MRDNTLSIYVLRPKCTCSKIFSVHLEKSICQIKLALNKMLRVVFSFVFKKTRANKKMKTLQRLDKVQRNQKADILLLNVMA